MQSPNFSSKARVTDILSRRVRNLRSCHNQLIVNVWEKDNPLDLQEGHYNDHGICEHL